MAFRIHDVTIQLMPDAQGAPCTMLSGADKPCEGKSHPPPCAGKTQKPKPGPGPGGGGPAGGEKGRSLAALRARLREALAPPPV